MFATWLDRIPGRDLRARGIIQFLFLMSCPIRGDQNLRAGDQIAESCFRRRTRIFSPIANELSSRNAGLRPWNFLDAALLRSGESYSNVSRPVISFDSAD